MRAAAKYMGRVSYPRRLKWGVLLAALCLALLNALFPPPLDRARIVSPLALDENGSWLTAFTVEDGRWRIKAELSEIDPIFIERLIAIEDKRFWTHSGVDPIAVVRAGRTWAITGHAKSGASTLTMQLVRQLEPRPRTLRSKLIESLRAAQIEMRLTKAEILELYLTHTPYGGNIEGISAASYTYFGKPPERLTDAQIAILIALPQAPEARRPDLRPLQARASRDLILGKLAETGYLSERRRDEAMEATVSTARHDFPQLGWLTAHHLRSDGQSRIRTTLNAKYQSEIQAKARQFVQSRDADVNTAILVIENKTRSVRASVGSADRARPGGWIDMTRAVRSPGSTLKPFIYGMAFDEGAIAPGSTIRDAPTRFGSYQPENFSKRYHGDVTVAQALQHSLNVPAVAALERVGERRFESALALSGAGLHIPKRADNRTGLAIALGGAGLSAEGLGILYSALAGGGEAKPLRWTTSAPDSTPYRLLSESSAAQITKILRQAPTPPGRVPAWLSARSAPIAYKTGTSYGFRDAWAAGYTDDWTVIVWVGRADGAPRPGQTGRKTAAPLLYDVLASLPNTSGRPHVPFERPDDAPAGLSALKGEDVTTPVILFPPDNTEVLVEDFSDNARGISLTARSPNRQALRWYVDGQSVGIDPLSGNAIWTPPSAGFYRLAVVNEDGDQAVSRVKVSRF